MSKRITIAEIEDFANFPAGSGLGDMARMLLEAAQRLADSPCPVCKGSGRKLEKHSTGEGIVSLSNAKFVYDPCPHCGTFPKDRRGKAYESKEAAIDSLTKGVIL